MIVDVHAHAVLEATFGAAGPAGPELGIDADGVETFRADRFVLRGVSYRDSAFMDADRRVAAMDEAGIDVQVLSPNPLTYFHHLDPATAQDFCRRHNDAMAEVCARHPSRLRGFAALPMQDPASAADELRRAVTDLGLVGPYVGTDLGRPLDDPALDPVYVACVDLGIPLFFHPEPPGTNVGPRDPRLARFDLDMTAGFAHEETITVATLVYSDLLMRHPTLDIAISHGGGAMAFLAGRLRRAAEVRPWTDEVLRQPGEFDRRLRRLHYDSHVHDSGSLALLRALVGDGRLLYGTNFCGWDAGAADHPSSGRSKAGPGETGLMETGLMETMGANATRLLGL